MTKSQDARNTLIEHYWPLVNTIAKQVYRRIRGTLSVDELTSFGAVGLIEAVERFNPEIQESFEGYASIRIRGSIYDELRAMDWVPRSIRVKEQTYNKAVDNLTIELNRNPTDEEIMVKLKLTESEFRRLSLDANVRGVRSIDEPVMGSDGQSMSLHDIIADLPPDESSDFNEAAHSLINSLPLRERIVLRLFYIEGLTIPEIADLMAFGESRASQIHASALESLRMERN